VLGNGIPTIDVDGSPNPHFWLDPSLVATHYVPAITSALSAMDPAGAATYQANAAAFIAQLTALDQANVAKIATIPLADRKLVTFHDAFPYFAAHYGFELIGVILPNVGQEPSAADLAALVEKVKAANVKAVFSEAQFRPELAHTLADEAGVTTVVTTLYNDTVGPPPDDTYLTMMAWNVDQIVKALS
jgi:zinc/manganese transport system substrate-binding protein/manganese/iron transport system substrate-binding protein